MNTNLFDYSFRQRRSFRINLTQSFIRQFRSAQKLCNRSASLKRRASELFEKLLKRLDITWKSYPNRRVYPN